MKVFKLSLLFFITALFITACNSNKSDRASYNEPYQTESAEVGPGFDEDDSWAKDNLDLQGVGELLEKAKSAEEFEYLLNSKDGVNNLDLNGDGYADYISVREFDDRYDNERGFSLFNMLGPDEIQEIATIIFDREGYNYPGARVLLTGNEQIYGDDYYYETNWRDRDLPIIDWLFSNRNDYYRSPYYYENYPDYYEPYRIVQTPVYRTRIEQYNVQPVFVQTAQPTIRQIKIKSPYKDKSLDKIYSKLAKPTKEQVKFIKNNPQPPKFVREKKEKMKDFSFRPDKPQRDNPNRFEKFDKPEKVKNERPQMREKPNKPERVNIQPAKPAKFEKPNMKTPKQEKKERPNGNGQKNDGGNKGGGNKHGGGKGKGKP